MVVALLFTRARGRRRRQYHLFQFPAINHEALPERGKRVEGEGRAGVAARRSVVCMAYHTAARKKQEASEDGSIALIFHDLSHSPLAFRGRHMREEEKGKRQGRHWQSKQASKRHTKHKGCPTRLGGGEVGVAAARAPVRSSRYASRSSDITTRY